MFELADRSKGSVCSTHDIRVLVEPRIISEASRPSNDEFRFAYRVTMSNDSAHTVRLESRHWIIVNAEGHREEVIGDGVIGCTPTLAPGEYFTYTSMCPLSTPWGTMEGTYTFVRTDDGASLDVRIARFFLAVAMVEAAATPV
jgi:ApaG protein